ANSPRNGRENQTDWNPPLEQSPCGKPGGTIDSCVLPMTNRPRRRRQACRRCRRRGCRGLAAGAGLLIDEAHGDVLVLAADVEPRGAALTTPPLASWCHSTIEPTLLRGEASSFRSPDFGDGRRKRRYGAAAEARLPGKERLWCHFKLRERPRGVSRALRSPPSAAAAAPNGGSRPRTRRART